MSPSSLSLAGTDGVGACYGAAASRGLPGRGQALFEHAVVTTVETVRSRGRSAHDPVGATGEVGRAAVGARLLVDAVRRPATPVLHLVPEVADRHLLGTGIDLGLLRLELDVRLLPRRARRGV